MEGFLGLKGQGNPRAGRKKKKKSASCVVAGIYYTNAFKTAAMPCGPSIDQRVFYTLHSINGLEILHMGVQLARSDFLEQARRWEQVMNRTPQQMTLEAAQMQLVGHDHTLFLPTSNPYPFDFNRRPHPFLEGNHDATMKFPLSKEVHHGPALGGISSVELPFISQIQAINGSAKGSLGQTPEIWSEAMLSQAPAQLTIFYGDGVYVYSDVTPEKAELIMSMVKDQPATSSMSRARQHLGVANNIHHPHATYPQGTVPQARRATLVRFLVKRKDRLRRDIYDLIKKSSESSIFPMRS